MSFIFRLEDYARYQKRVGEATYVDVTRRTDPARISRVWENLRSVFETYGPPWMVQLWTKDAAGVIGRGRALLEAMQKAGSTLCAQVTVTGLAGTVWEPGSPQEPFTGVGELAALVGGAHHVAWRFDPVIPGLWSSDRFRDLVGRAGRLGITRCVANFIAPPGRYKTVDRRLAEVLPGWSEGMPGFDESWKTAVLTEMAGIARAHGIQVGACAESAFLSDAVHGMQRAACGDHDWFVELSGRDPGPAPTRGSRPGCGCAAYFDVGLYGQWSRCHRCLYCYAG